DHLAEDGGETPEHHAQMDLQLGLGGRGHGAPPYRGCRLSRIGTPICALRPAPHAPPRAQLNMPISSSCWPALSSSPWPALSWSAWRSGLPVAGMTTVTAGWLIANFRNICDHDVTPTSAAQPGSARPPTRPNSRPS